MTLHTTIDGGQGGNDAYTVYEVTRRTDSEYPTFAGLQIEDEKIIEQIEVDADHSYCDVIRVKVPGCGVTFEQAMNGRDEVTDYREVERNWFTAYDYENLSETPLVSEGGHWLQLWADYASDPRGSYKPATVNEIEALLDQIAAETFMPPNDDDFEGARWALGLAN
jgi:hypothetical protein